MVSVQMAQEKAENEVKISKARSKRCGMCDQCMRGDCGVCNHCKDMTKFGGSGKSKQACKERKCNNMAVKEEDDSSSETDEPVVEKSPVKTPVKHKANGKHKDVEWKGEGTKKGRKTYYNTAILDGDLTLTLGDTVLIQPTDPSTPLYVAIINNMFDGPDGYTAHVQWYGRGTDTMLGESADPSELFLLTDCEDQPLLSVWKKCSVDMKPVPDMAEWRELGGDEVPEEQADDGLNFWCQLWYDPENARFEYPVPLAPCPEGEDKAAYCGMCVRKGEEDKRWKPVLGEKTEVGEYSSVTWDRAPLKVGDAEEDSSSKTDEPVVESSVFNAMFSEQMAQEKAENEGKISKARLEKHIAVKNAMDHHMMLLDIEEEARALDKEEMENYECEKATDEDEDHEAAFEDEDENKLENIAKQLIEALNWIERKISTVTGWIDNQASDALVSYGTEHKILHQRVNMKSPTIYNAVNIGRNCLERESNDLMLNWNKTYISSTLTSLMESWNHLLSIMEVTNQRLKMCRRKNVRGQKMMENLAGSFSNANPARDQLKTCRKQFEQQCNNMEEEEDSSSETDEPVVESSVFDAMFSEQMAQEKAENEGKISKARSKMCGMCDQCMRGDCGVCNHCEDMTKFGGSGKSKQSCKERKCNNMEEEELQYRAIDENDVGMKLKSEGTTAGLTGSKVTVADEKVNTSGTCGQLVDSPDTIRCESHPQGAVEEFIGMPDSKLSMYEEGDSQEESMPQSKLTGFTVYNKAGHVVPFDTGLIHADVLKMSISQRAASILLGREVKDKWWPWYKEPLVHLYEARFNVMIVLDRNSEEMQDVSVHMKGKGSFPN